LFTQKFIFNGIIVSKIRNVYHHLHDDSDICRPGSGTLSPKEAAEPGNFHLFSCEERRFSAAPGAKRGIIDKIRAVNREENDHFITGG
jgi:hypothetical protein